MPVSQLPKLILFTPLLEAFDAHQGFLRLAAAYPVYNVNFSGSVSRVVIACQAATLCSLAEVWLEIIAAGRMEYCSCGSKAQRQACAWVSS